MLKAKEEIKEQKILEYLRRGFTSFTWMFSELPSFQLCLSSKYQNYTDSTHAQKKAWRNCGHSLVLSQQCTPKFTTASSPRQSTHPDSSKWGRSWERTRREKCGSMGWQQGLLLPSCPTLDEVSLSRIVKLGWWVNPRSNLYSTPLLSHYSLPSDFCPSLKETWP